MGIWNENHDDAQITLDLSDSGPVFGALDDMMMKMMEDDERVRPWTLCQFTK